jgi:hypothetical protein
MRNLFFLAFGGLCLAIALTLAWVLGVTLFCPNGFLAGFIVDRASLIKAHIDYLMMAQFLFIFFLLFRQFSLDPPIWVVAASCYGAFFNPLGFLRVALTPKVAVVAPIEPHFPLSALVSFSLTTIGFLAAVALIARAAWKSRRLSVEFTSTTAQSLGAGSSGE